MPITVSDLKFFQSERMTDEADGGGRMSAIEIAPGAENSVCDDISDVDRAAGDVSIRKFYAAVTNPEPEKYLDAGIAVFKPPADPAVSVVIFSTGDFYDERQQLKERLESAITRGSAHQGYLWGPHQAGARAVTLWQYPEAKLPDLGMRLELVARAGTVTLYSQVLWVIKVVDTLMIVRDGQDTITIRQVICELAAPLVYNFEGGDPKKSSPSVSSLKALLYETRYNADAVAIYGIQPLTADAAVGDYTLRIAGLYAPMIPTAFSETALADVTPGGDDVQMAAASEGEVSTTTTLQVVKPGVSWHLGTGCLPGSLRIAVSGATITDLGGVLNLAGNQIGTIEYSNGVCVWNDSCPNYGTASKTATWTPAAQAVRIADTAAQPVTVTNRGFVWVFTLGPIPSPGSTRVSYRVNNQWYTLADDGSGALRGVDSSYGSGSVNFASGTVTITTGELPDVGSEILYFWGTEVNYKTRGGGFVPPPRVVGKTANGAVTPGSVSVTWGVGDDAKTLTDAAFDGNLSGEDGVGFIRYLTGEWWVMPNVLPEMGTDFTIDYEYGPPITETIPAPLRNLEGDLQFTLTNLPRPGTVNVQYQVIVEAFDTSTQLEYSTIPKPKKPDPPDKPNPKFRDLTPCVKTCLNNAQGGLGAPYTPFNIATCRAACGEG